MEYPVNWSAISSSFVSMFLAQPLTLQTEFISMYMYRVVKPVYKDHSRENAETVVI